MHELVEGLSHAARLGYHAHVRLIVDQRARSQADRGVVINEQYPDRPALGRVRLDIGMQGFGMG
ncbi:MAG: hypothetical protein M3Y09_11845 [Actinomycetota bacterium]|nr:hypothetical protein [Actinomycetota bacterium]